MASGTEETILEDDPAQTQITGQRIVLITSQDMMTVVETEVEIEATVVAIVAEIDLIKVHEKTSNYSKLPVLLVVSLAKYLSVPTAQSQYCVRNVSPRRMLLQWVATTSNAETDLNQMYGQSEQNVHNKHLLPT